MEEYWCEGNTNQALYNIYHALNSKRLAVIKDICEYYIKGDQEVTKDEAINWMDNNLGIFFEGFRPFDGDTSSFDIMYKMIAEKAPYLKRTTSFESIILFLLRQPLSKLKKCLEAQRACFEQHNCDVTLKPQKPKLKPKPQQGGSNRYEALLNFRDINPNNVKLAKKIMKPFMVSSNMMDTYNVYKLGQHLITTYKLESHVFEYSNRVRVDDVWKMVMFMLKLQV